MKRVVLNEPFQVPGELASVTVQSERIEHTFDEQALGEGPAEAIRDAIARQIRAVTAAASPATVAKRQSGSTRLLNDTGRLVRELAATPAADGSWNIVAPPGLRDPSTYGATLEKLRELVLAARDPTTAPEVRAAVEKTVPQMIRKRSR